jgi:hypothetical protein
MKRRLVQYVLILLLFVSCNETENDLDIHPFCASQSCSIQGKKELVETYTSNLKILDTLFINIKVFNTTDKNTNQFKIKEKILHLNDIFKEASIQFILDTLVVKRTSPYTIDQIESSDKIRNKVTKDLEKENIINLFIVPKGEFLNGFTYVVPDTFINYLNLKCNTIFINDEAWLNQSTIAHELGHFFGLQHTFGSNPKENTTKELPNGSNCKTEGDFICDTPADPNGLINKNCQFMGLSSKQQQHFSPLVNNYMSYYRNSCKNEFTKGQYLAMNQFANKFRKYLSVKN